MESNLDDKVRIDKYLWSIRCFKTRTLASAACNDGKVKLNEDTPVKPAKIVKENEIYSVKNGNKKMVIKVIKIIDSRVNPTLAALCFIDLTPEEEKEKQKLMSAFYFSGGKKGNKQARPTKKDRRKINELRGDI
jgi:ribosome-associated heat shock protein Hsp15